MLRRNFRGFSSLLIVNIRHPLNGKQQIVFTLFIDFFLTRTFIIELGTAQHRLGEGDGRVATLE